MEWLKTMHIYYCRVSRVRIWGQLRCVQYKAVIKMWARAGFYLKSQLRKNLLLRVPQLLIEFSSSWLWDWGQLLVSHWTVAALRFRPPNMTAYFIKASRGRVFLQGQRPQSCVTYIHKNDI